MDDAASSNQGTGEAEQRERFKRSRRHAGSHGALAQSDIEMRKAMKADLLRLSDGEITAEQEQEAIRKHTIAWHAREIGRLIADESLV